MAAVVVVGAFAVGGAGATFGGGLDKTFGNGGRAAVDFGAGEYLTSVAVERDGKVVAAGAIGTGQPNSALVIRLTPDGKLDPSFGVGGRVVISRMAYRSAAGLQPDGKVIVAGMVWPGTSSVILTRLNEDGSIDSSFGAGGYAARSTGTYSAPYHVLVASDGKILIVGQTDSGTYGNSDILVLRFTPDGGLDPTFGSGGVAVSDWGRFDVPFGAALAADGTIIVGGFREESNGANPVAAVERLTADGKLDSSFGSGGIVVTTHDAFNMAGGVAVQSDGKVLLAAGVPYAVLRLTHDGQPDASFGSAGWSATETSNSAVARAVAVQPNGKIVVVGRTQEAGHAVFLVKRLLPNGVVDHAFAGATPDVPGSAFPEFIRVAPDGRIITGGWTYGQPGTANMAMVFRYLPGTCSVPQVVGKKLAAAQSALLAANCRVGNVKPVRSTRLPKGAVVAQKPAAGREVADWAAVALSVSRGKK